VRAVKAASSRPSSSSAVSRHLAGRCGERAVAVAEEEPDPGGAFAEVDEQVAGLPGGLRPGGVGRDAQDVRAAGVDLHHGQDVQAVEDHGGSVREVARQDPGCRGGRELPPGG
jgi:hypothetical protein